MIGYDSFEIPITRMEKDRLDGSLSVDYPLIRACKISPCSRYIAVGCHKLLKIFRSDTGHHLKTLAGHMGRIGSCCYSPCGRYIATGSTNGLIKLWDADPYNGYDVSCMTIKAHAGDIRQIDFSPCGQYMVSCSHDYLLKLWSVQSGECLLMFRGHTDRIVDCCYSPCGKYIVSASTDHTLRIWSSEPSKSGMEICLSTVVCEGRVINCCFSDCGQYVICGICGNSGGILDCFRLQSLENLQRFSDISSDDKSAIDKSAIMGRGFVKSCSVSPCGRYVLYDSKRDRDFEYARIRRFDSGRFGDVESTRMFRKTSRSDYITKCLFSPNGRFIVVAMMGSVYVLNMQG